MKRALQLAQHAPCWRSGSAEHVPGQSPARAHTRSHSALCFARSAWRSFSQRSRAALQVPVSHRSTSRTHVWRHSPHFVAHASLHESPVHAFLHAAHASLHRPAHASHVLVHAGLHFSSCSSRHGLGTHDCSKRNLHASGSVRDPDCVEVSGVGSHAQSRARKATISGSVHAVAADG